MLQVVPLQVDRRQPHALFDAFKEWEIANLAKEDFVLCRGQIQSTAQLLNESHIATAAAAHRWLDGPDGDAQLAFGELELTTSEVAHSQEHAGRRLTAAIVRGQQRDTAPRRRCLRMIPT
jgi:hypothetical protein